MIIFEDGQKLRERVKKSANHCKAISSTNGSKSYRRALLRVSRRGVEVHGGVREAIREGGNFPKIKVLIQRLTRPWVIYSTLNKSHLEAGTSAVSVWPRRMG